MQMPGVPMPLPDWYPLFPIAEKWGMKPEDVLHEPSYWVTRQQILMGAESWVQAENAKKGG
jgi:hypothetical protein